MSTDFPIGATVWQELETPSTAGIADFYAAVLGWDLTVDGEHGLFTLDGEVVAGLHVDPAMQGGRIGWRCYLGAEDLGAATDRAVRAGATVATAAKRLAIAASAVELTDPFGGWFGLALPEAGAAVPPSTQLGHMVLVDPTNHDLAAMVEFQHALFPGNALDSLDHGINLFRDDDGLALRGAYEVPEEARGALPPHWLPWFAVADQRKATEIAAANGGGVETVDNELSFGLWGVVADPAGGLLKVLQLNRDAL